MWVLIPDLNIIEMWHLKGLFLKFSFELVFFVFKCMVTSLVSGLQACGAIRRRFNWRTVDDLEP